MPRRVLLLLVLAALAAAEKYEGPRPPKPDLPYLKQASNLIPLEDAIAQESDKRRDDITYTIDGATSPVATPLAEPVFLLQADKLIPEKLELFRLEVKSGHREVRVTARNSATLHLEATRYDADTLWRIEVDGTLDPGEYALSQADDPSNRAFCFRVR